MYIFLRFIRNAWNYKARLIVSVLCIIGVNLFQIGSIGSLIPIVDRIANDSQIAVPKSVIAFFTYIGANDLLQRVIHYLNTTNRHTLVIQLTIFFLLATALRGLFDYVMKVTMESVAQGVMRDFMQHMHRHLQILPVQYFAKTRTGELISRLTNDVNLVQASLSARLIESVCDITQLPFLAFFLLVTDWKMTLLLSLAVPLLMGPIIVIGQRLRRLSKKSQEKIADIMSMLQETITGIRIVRAFNMEQYEMRRFDHQADRFYRLRMKAIRRDALIGPLTEIVGIGCALLVANIMLGRVLQKQLSPGFLVAYIAQLVIMMKPLRSIGKVNSLIQRAVGALVRIYDLLDTKSAIVEIPADIELPQLQRDIRFEHVAFAYDPEGTPVIKDLNLQVKAGEMIALVGPSGGGKTTFANLIPRFYDVTAGAILFDGVDLRDATFASLRGQIGMVTQETILFNDSVRNNIAYGRADIPLDDVIAAAQAANADGFIREMPEGYDTIIGERGVRLSGGQRQRLAIARAILKNPRVLILDEATSALDTESERLVQEAIDNLIKNRTVFAIAHRLSTIQHADRILVLVDGDVVQIGTHDALIVDEDGLYKKLHDMQFRDTGHAVPSGFIDFIKFKLRQARERRAQRRLNETLTPPAL